MDVYPVSNCTHIIRIQMEFSLTTQRFVLRCILETPATGERRGFTDMDALTAALYAELTDMQDRMTTHFNNDTKET